MPSTPYIVSGIVYTSKGSVASSKVRINYDIIATTNSEGKYQLDLANLTDGYTSGSSYTIEAWDEFDNEYKSDTITATGGGQTKDIYLESRSTSQGKAVGQLTPVILRTTGDSDITIDNPLMVWTTPRPLTKKMVNLSSGQPQYISEASPGTPTSEAKWRIKKFIYGDGNTKPPTEELWANGNAKFNKIHDNRASYSYS